MAKLIWGIVIAIFGLIFFATAGNNTQGPGGSIIMGMLSLAGGGLMIFFGARYLNRSKTITGFALQMLHSDNKIDANELAQRLGMNEIEIRKYLSDAQRKGIIPFKADII
jgi:hypothetical protein